MDALPTTPDFVSWPIEYSVSTLAHTPEALTIIWSDGASSQYHALLLRENSPDAATTHPKAREMCIAPTDIPADLHMVATEVLSNGAVAVTFSDGTVSAYHPGWLRGNGWFGDDEWPEPVLWRGVDP